MNLNLARRPFVNSRPITRLAVLLWLMGGALALWNGLEIWRLTSSLGERRRALAAAELRAAEGQARIAGLQAELRDIDLLEENEETAFLNREIERRTLSWTGLFQRLGEVLPRQVRLLQISPSLASPAQRRRPPGEGSEEGWIALSLTGFAESDEALLDFVDTLFAHPSFDAPDLEREAVPPGEPIRFELKVSYLSREARPTPALAGVAADRPAGAPAAPGPATTTVPAVVPGAAEVPPVARSTDRAFRPAAAGAEARPAGTAIAAADEPSAPAEPAAGAPDPAPSRQAESTARWSPRAGRAADSDGSAGLAGDWSGPAVGASVPSAPPTAGVRRGAHPVPLGAAASPTRRLR